MFNSLNEEFEYYFKNLETNLCSFERDYYDIDNFYNLIQIGTRFSDKEKLVKECWKKLNELYKNNLCGTPDFGGLLCVLMYNTPDIDLNVFSTELNIYLENMDKNNPHCIRWAISLTYKLGELEYDGGHFSQARDNFIRCISYDFKLFNSLIVSKQMMACEKLARIYLNSGKSGAEEVLEKGLELYKDAMSYNLDKTIGKDGCYIYFGCVEMAELCDMASQLVKFLQNIDIYGTPKFEEEFENKRWGLYKYCASLENKIKELENGIN